MNASKCCVWNCKNTRPVTILHRFPDPEKELDRFNNWIFAIGGNALVLDPKSVFRNGRICHSHFKPKFYTTSKRLSKNAVPSLFLSDLNNPVSEEAPVKDGEEISPPSPSSPSPADAGDPQPSAAPSEPTKPSITTTYTKTVPYVYRRKYDPAVPICRACLSNRRKLYNIHETDVLAAYQHLTGMQVTDEDRLPNTLCSHCIILLRKFHNFRENCKKAAAGLKEALYTNYLIDANKLQNLCYQRSEIEQFNIIQDQDVTQDGQGGEGEDAGEGIYITEADNLDHMDIAQEMEIKEEPATTTSSKKKPKKMKRKPLLECPKLLKEFETKYYVDVTKMTDEEKFQDVLDRKSTANYLNSPNTCDLCFRGFMAPDLLVNHYMLHHNPDIGEIVCEYCKFRYKSEQDLTIHILSRHTTRMSCRLCPRITRNTLECKKHYEICHQNQKYTTCEHCGESFRALSSFLVHLSKDHPSELIWCDLCGESFVRQDTLDRHKQKRHKDLHLSVQCERCSVLLLDGSALERHLNDGYCSGYTCVHCGLGYIGAMQLRDHLLKVHGSKMANIVFPCPQCDKVYRQGGQLRLHLRNVHLNINRSVICEVCGKVVRNNRAMKVHTRVHTGERPFECPVCLKGFISKWSMTKHRASVHSTVRPHACDKCPKAFKGRHNLVRHKQKGQCPGEIIIRN